MENKVKLVMEIGLQRDEERGDVSIVAFDVPVGVAERVCEEQEKCALLSENGELTKLLNAYALVNGYQCAWFVSATMQESAECRVQSAGNVIHIPYNLAIGQEVYALLDEDFSDVLEERVGECTVTEIGSRGFWVSDFVPPPGTIWEVSSNGRKSARRHFSLGRVR